MKISDALGSAFKAVATDHKRQKRQADRNDKLSRSQLERLRGRSYRVTIKDAAYRVMTQAYMHASANNTLPANARQIMYAARPLVMERAGGQCWENDSYFTQHLLPDFLDNYPELTANWDVVYDARGNIVEPHTKKRVPLGTLSVRRYIGNWAGGASGLSDITNDLDLPHEVETVGPTNRYRFVLFVEKEGFNELFEAVRLADRYDLAIMSTKGMSVTAARHLVSSLSDRGVIILVIHDFDKAGLSIFHTLKSNTRRWRYDAIPNVIDLGLRLADVQEMGLQGEQVEYSSGVNPKWNLLESGATEDECNFLVRGVSYGRWGGERVELNAMTSDQLIAWLERKLQEAGVTKLVPNEDVLAAAYHRASKLAAIQKAIDQASSEFDDDVSIPENLTELVSDRLQGKSAAWDDVIFELAQAEQGK
jgi:hypothetical protein